MSDDLGPSERTRVRRGPTHARYDEATVNSIIDATTICHLAVLVDGRAVAM